MSYLFTVRVCLNPAITIECDKPVVEIREIAAKLPGLTEHDRLHLVFMDTLFPHSRVHHSQELACVVRELPPVVIWYDRVRSGQWMVLDLHCPHMHGCTDWKLHPVERYFHVPTYLWKSTDRVWICDNSSDQQDTPVCPLSKPSIPHIPADTVKFYTDLIHSCNHEYFSFDRITEVYQTRDNLQGVITSRSEWSALLPQFLRDKEIDAYRLWVERCGNKQMASMLAFVLDIVHPGTYDEKKSAEWLEEWEQFYVAVERRERNMEMVTRHT